MGSRAVASLIVGALVLPAIGCGGGDDAPSQPAAPVDCGFVEFAPQTDNGAFGIRARGVGCATARRVARASRDVRGEGRPRYSAHGFACRGSQVDDELDLPGVSYRCSRGAARVTFTRN